MKKPKKIDRRKQTESLFRLLHTVGLLDNGGGFLRKTQECIDIAKELMADAPDYSESSYGIYVRDLIIEDLKKRGMIKTPATQREESSQ